MEVRSADLDDVVSYMALGRAAQAWLQSRGLNQYVPAAHDEYTASIRSCVESRTLFAVQDCGETVGYFSLDPLPSPWWPADEAPALYLAGMVLARSARSRGVGAFIIEWSLAEAVRRGLKSLRLDCHAENLWLCRYYESHHFERRGQVEQHPGYYGCLYECEVKSADSQPRNAT